MELKENHYKCIELILKGLKYTEIAQLVPCSRTAIYNWLADEDFKLALDNERQEIKTRGNNRIMSKLDTYIDKIEDLAFNSSSDAVKLNALQLLYETINGKPTSKVEQMVKETKDNNKDILDLDKINKLPADKSIDNKIININRAK